MSKNYTIRLFSYKRKRTKLWIELVLPKDDLLQCITIDVIVPAWTPYISIWSDIRSGPLVTKLIKNYNMSICPYVVADWPGLIGFEKTFKGTLILTKVKQHWARLDPGWGNYSYAAEPKLKVDSFGVNEGSRKMVNFQPSSKYGFISSYLLRTFEPCTWLSYRD